MELEFLENKKKAAKGVSPRFSACTFVNTDFKRTLTGGNAFWTSGFE